MKNKYKYNKKADAYLNKFYAKHKAETVWEKTKVLETLPRYKNGYSISHFRRGSSVWLRAMEVTLLMDMNLIDFIIC